MTRRTIRTEDLVYIPEFLYILTVDGWLELGKITMNSKILTVNNDGGKRFIMWENPTTFSAFNYAGIIDEIKVLNYSVHDFQKEDSSFYLKNYNQEFSTYLKPLQVSNEKVKWEGKLISMTFNYPCSIAISNGINYILITV